MILIMTRDKEVGESWHEMVCAYSIIIFGSKGNNTLIMERWNDSTKSNKKVAISIIIIISLKKEAVFPLCIFELFHVQPWVHYSTLLFFPLPDKCCNWKGFLMQSSDISSAHILCVSNWACIKNINIHTPFILGRSMLRIYIGKKWKKKKQKRKMLCCTHANLVLCFNSFHL